LQNQIFLQVNVLLDPDGTTNITSLHRTLKKTYIDTNPFILILKQLGIKALNIKY